MAPAKEEIDSFAPPEANLDKMAVDVVHVDERSEISFSVKFYYTPEFAASTADIDGFLDQVIAETNQGFANSGINLKVMNLVYK